MRACVRACVHACVRACVRSACFFQAVFAAVVLQGTLQGYEGTKACTCDALMCAVDLMCQSDTPEYFLLYLCRCVRDVVKLRCGLGNAMVMAGIMSPLMNMLRSRSTFMASLAAEIVLQLVKLDDNAVRHLINGSRLDRRIFDGLDYFAPAGAIPEKIMKKWIDVQSFGLPEPS